MKEMHEVEIVRIDLSTRTAHKSTDCVAKERPLHIFLNESHYATIWCSPSFLTELATGHLLSEGIIESVEEIEKLSLRDDEVCRIKLVADVNVKKLMDFSRLRPRIVLSGCGGQATHRLSPRLSKVKSRTLFKAETVSDCVNRLNSTAEAFRKTGGVHVAAIYRRVGSPVALAEDVGRHNAVDKAIGLAAMRKIDFSNCFLALSGRLSGEIVSKTVRVGLPLVASLAAALDSGIEIANRAGLTLAGFVRGKRMNVYTFPERILVS